VGDGGVGEEALGLALGERRQVAVDHGEEHREGEHRDPDPAVAGPDHHSEERGEGGGLDPGGHVEGHRGGSPLVDVRGPPAKGDHRRLEEKTREQEHHPGGKERPLGDRAHGEAPGGAEVEDQPVEVERGRDRAEEEVLEGGFLAWLVVTEGDEGVEGEGEELEPHQDHREVGTGRHRQRPNRREGEQGVVLKSPDPGPLEVPAPHEAREKEPEEGLFRGGEGKEDQGHQKPQANPEPHRAGRGP